MSSPASSASEGRGRVIVFEDPVDEDLAAEERRFSISRANDSWSERSWLDAVTARVASSRRASISMARSRSGPDFVLSKL